jgi:hypothetical protein
MSDLRGTGREIEPTSGTSKALAAFIVAIGVGAAGAYVYTSNGGLPQKDQAQQVAMNSDNDTVAPLTPPPAQTGISTTPQAERTPAMDTAQPSAPAAATPPASTAPAARQPQRVARAKARTGQPEQHPAVTPPDTTSVPDVPTQTTMPATAEPSAVQPPPATPQAQPDASQQPQSPDQAQSTPQ